MPKKIKTEHQRREYATQGVSSVDGMLQSGAISVLWSLMELQDYFNINGHIAEIGVHQGKLLLFLSHWLNEGEISTGVDVFGNPPGSNTRDIKNFASNVTRLGFEKDSVNLVIKDSLLLRDEDITSLFGGRTVRMFSVDGDHSKDAVINDLVFATKSLCEGGVIIADDIFNAWYPAVTEAIYEILEKNREQGLEPIGFIAANGPLETGASKLLVSLRSHAKKYKAGLKLLNQDNLKHCDSFAGYKDVPFFCFDGEPIKRPLKGFVKDILAEIVKSQK
ncbi:MAG: class I SAM-dependent methyltransferase [Pseudomonadota bacterium]|nr:class I SAM-dependent methyltransferase [Pseudomonadota bacterium]